MNIRIWALIATTVAPHAFGEGPAHWSYEGAGGPTHWGELSPENLFNEWNKRGYGLDVVWYKKYDGSTYVDPKETEKVAFEVCRTDFLR